MVEAAGGLVTRAGEHGIELLVVHRPRYDDWSLPKGKLEPGETHEAAARREVEEETGWQCELGDELLPAVRYTDRHGRPKRVRYWRMRAVDQGKWEPNHEIDQVLWIPASEAATLLSYDVDRTLVETQLGGRVDHTGGAG
jgi:8-oxo-dGTP diphosphatase